MLAKRYARDRLPERVQLFLFDGSRAADVTHYARLSIRSSGPSIQLPLLIASLPSDVPVILGMEYLRATRPGVDWEDGRLLFKLVADPFWEDERPLHLSPRQSSAIPPVSSLGILTPGSYSGLGANSTAPGSKSELVSRFFDPDEDPDDVADVLRIVSKTYHAYVDVFSKARVKLCRRIDLTTSSIRCGIPIYLLRRYSESAFIEVIRKFQISET